METLERAPSSRLDHGEESFLLFIPTLTIFHGDPQQSFHFAQNPRRKINLPPPANQDQPFSKVRAFRRPRRQGEHELVLLYVVLFLVMRENRVSESDKKMLLRALFMSLSMLQARGRILEWRRRRSQFGINGKASSRLHHKELSVWAFCLHSGSCFTLKVSTLLSKFLLCSDHSISILTDTKAFYSNTRISWEDDGSHEERNNETHNQTLGFRYINLYESLGSIVAVLRDQEMSVFLLNSSTLLFVPVAKSSREDLGRSLWTSHLAIDVWKLETKPSRHIHDPSRDTSRPI